jgi:hypothetical protein
MLEIDWDAEKGWSVPKITPYHFLSISPAASSLHYGIEVRFVNVLATVTLRWFVRWHCVLFASVRFVSGITSGTAVPLLDRVPALTLALSPASHHSALRE